MSDRTPLTVLLLVLVGTVAGSTVVPSAPGPTTVGEASQTGFVAEAVTYDGDAAVEDGSITVRGTAREANRVVVVLVDTRADTVANATAVDANGTFSVDVSFRDADGRLSGGDVAGLAISPGPDGVFGLPGQGPDSAAAFVQFARSLQRRGITREEVLDRLTGESVDQPGSDDESADVSFRLTGARLSVRDVVSDGRNGSGVRPVAVGTTMTVRGVTNRRPAGNAVTVGVTAGPTPEAFATATATEWGRDGTWTVDLAVPRSVQPGTYTLEATQGEQVASVSVRIVESVPTTTRPEPTTRREPTTTTRESTTTRRDPTTSRRPDRPPRDGSGNGGIGFQEVLPIVGIALGGLGVVLLVVVVVRRRKRHPPRL